MKRTSAYLCLFFVMNLLGCSLKKNALPDMRETYLSADKKPFGGQVAFRILENSFPGQFIQKTSLPFASGMSGFSGTSAVYCCISRNFFIDNRDAEAIFDFAEQGNTFFLSAANIDTILLSKLMCKTDNIFWEESFRFANYTTSVLKLGNEVAVEKDSFSYFYYPFFGHISSSNKTESRIIGYNSVGKPNCLVFFHGKGKLIVHNDPRAFSNYFLLTDNNYLYVKQLLQLIQTPPENIYWNEYYSRQNHREGGSDFSSLNEILKYPGLAWGFWLSLLLLIIYILFAGKRKQRVIPVLKPNVNSSIAFTETIARLYLQKHDNKNIADKMIMYFHEYIRSHYYLSANAGSPPFIESLSRKSGVPLEKTVALYKAIEHAGQNERIDDFQLLSLNEQIQQFYNKRK